MTIPVEYDQADWGSSEIYGDGDLTGLWVPDKVVVHWGGLTVPPVTTAGVKRLFRGWQRYHIGTKGWRDIAYNYGEGLGDRYRHRGWNPSGATSGDFEHDGIPENNEAVACVWAGGSGGPITAADFEGMALLVSDILKVIARPVDVVIGHRDVKHNTTCPGDEWMDWVNSEGWKYPGPPPPPGADEEADYMVVKSALQAEPPEYYVALADQTGYPRGSDPGYWGRTGQPKGPTDEEWDRPTEGFGSVTEELLFASLQAGVMHHPEAIPGPEGPVGPEGPQGPQGVQGVQGVRGPAGPKPVAGDIVNLTYRPS